MSLYFYAFLEVKKEKEYMVHEKCKTLLEFHKVLHISAGLSVLKWIKINLCLYQSNSFSFTQP